MQHLVIISGKDDVLSTAAVDSKASAYGPWQWATGMTFRAGSDVLRGLGRGWQGALKVRYLTGVSRCLGLMCATRNDLVMHTKAGHS
jgi:hypothetical protein